MAEECSRAEGEKERSAAACTSCHERLEAEALPARVGRSPRWRTGCIRRRYVPGPPLPRLRRAIEIRGLLAVWGGAAGGGVSKAATVPPSSLQGVPRDRAPRLVGHVVA